MNVYLHLKYIASKFQLINFLFYNAKILDVIYLQKIILLIGFEDQN